MFKFLLALLFISLNVAAREYQCGNLLSKDFEQCLDKSRAFAEKGLDFEPKYWEITFIDFFPTWTEGDDAIRILITQSVEKGELHRHGENFYRPPKIDYEIMVGTNKFLRTIGDIGADAVIPLVDIPEGMSKTTPISVTCSDCINAKDIKPAKLVMINWKNKEKSDKPKPNDNSKITKDKIDKLKDECEKLGYEPDSSKFKECVIELL